ALFERSLMQHWAQMIPINTNIYLPNVSKAKVNIRELSPYNLFCRDLLRNKGERQYLTDAFNCYTKWFVVVYNGPVYIRGLQGFSSAATPSTKDQVSVLVGKVQDLFRQKYKEAGGTGRLPYQSLVNQGMTIKVAGLPNSLTLKKPSFYGRNQLEAILKAAEEISFEINSKFHLEEESSETATTVAIVMTADKDGGNLCCVCRVHFDDKKKNAKKKWRSWSQCTVCQSWSHTACGFKNNLCLYCQI
uniref:Zgc:113176 n=1 Tax=Sinocyclocheilus anshuiensis TaxID=1608454 RepID=A0A671S7Q9_9TELE